jgi:integrase
VNVERGIHLGYRRLKNQGRWVIRRHLGKGSRKTYAMKVIGEADDTSDADGITVLTYDQALAKAREKPKSRVGPYTVRRAIEDYISYLKSVGKDHRTAETRANAHIVPQLGDIEVAELTSKDIRDWLAALASKPARLRTAKGKDQKFKSAPATDEELQRRKSTANRNLTVLKAALNHAYDEHKIDSNAAWGRRVKPFRAVEGKRDRFLTLAEVRQLLDACEGNFRDLVRAALETGCRFGELTRLTPRDFHRDAGTVYVARSKSGKSRHVVLTEQGVDFFAGLTELFAHWNRTEQRRKLKAAIVDAEIASITFHGLRHTYASLCVMHGVPLQVVAANLGHSDTRMVERHYGHLSPSFLSDAIKSGAPRYE